MRLDTPESHRYDHYSLFQFEQMLYAILGLDETSTKADVVDEINRMQKRGVELEEEYKALDDAITGAGIYL